MLAHTSEPLSGRSGADAARKQENGAGGGFLRGRRGLHAVPASYDAEAVARAYAFCAQTMRRSSSSFSEARLRTLP